MVVESRPYARVVEMWTRKRNIFDFWYRLARTGLNLSADLVVKVGVLFILDLDTCFVVYPSFSCQILCSRLKVGHDRFLPNRIDQLLTVTFSFKITQAFC